MFSGIGTQAASSNMLSRMKQPQQPSYDDLQAQKRGNAEQLFERMKGLHDQEYAKKMEGKKPHRVLGGIAGALGGMEVGTAIANERRQQSQDASSAAGDTAGMFQRAMEMSGADTEGALKYMMHQEGLEAGKEEGEAERGLRSDLAKRESDDKLQYQKFMAAQNNLDRELRAALQAGDWGLARDLQAQKLEVDKALAEMQEAGADRRQGEGFKFQREEGEAERTWRGQQGAFERGSNERIAAGRNETDLLTSGIERPDPVMGMQVKSGARYGNNLKTVQDYFDNGVMIPESVIRNADPEQQEIMLEVNNEIAQRQKVSGKSTQIGEPRNQKGIGVRGGMQEPSARPFE